MGGFGGQGNQNTGFNNNQQPQQQQQGNFGSQMGASGGGNFANQGHSFGSTSSGFGSTQNTGNFGSQSSYSGGSNFGGSAYGGQMSSGMNTAYGVQGGGYGNPSAQQSTPFNQQQQQQQQQQQTGYADTTGYASAGSGSFFGGMQTQIKQEPQAGGAPGMVSYPGYQ